MPNPTRPPSPANPAATAFDLGALSSPWAGGSLLYSRWLIMLLDVQTAFWKDAERYTANLMQPWIDPKAPPPSAQPLLDGSRGLGLNPFDPMALQRGWAAWTQVWVNALKHDTAGS